MTNKEINLKSKQLVVYELKGFFRRPRVTEQKVKFDHDCKTLLTLFAKLAKVNKLPKNSQDIIDWIGQSYQNCEGTFITRKPTALVLDIDHVLDQLVK